jgi:hypothetical protein
MKFNIVNSVTSRKFGDAVRVTILTGPPGYTAAKRYPLLPDGNGLEGGFSNLVLGTIVRQRRRQL